jgi:D-methionine transport system ATP-binding protein
MPLVCLRDVGKRYGEVTALEGVDLDIERGDVHGIIGYSGAGKSTLVRLINALEPVSAGSITVDGQEITRMPERELRRLRSGIGMIFQQFNLFGSRTVAGNVAYPLAVAGVDRTKRAARVAELLDFVGLADKARAYPDQLSGGQKQRVGIARALATSPGILLADEATSALDPETTQEVLALLGRVNREFGVTMVVITHEMDVIQSIATKVAVMDAGRIVEQGEVFDVFSRPKHGTSSRFVSTVVKGVPSPAELAVLRERHDGRLVTLSFHDGGASQSAAFAQIAQSGVEFELVYGGINDIRGRAFGHLTLAVRGEDAEVSEAIRRVRAAGVAVVEGTGETA